MWAEIVNSQVYVYDNSKLKYLKTSHLKILEN
jgi:hypothetical protein